MLNQQTLNKDVFYVVSQPITIILENDKPENVVLEIASIISNDAKNYTDETKRTIRLLEDVQEKLYIDPLTGALNRRFLDEMKFLHYGQNSVAKKIALVMIDLYRFKQINDLFGHQAGDKVLKDIVIEIKKCIRATDFIIRYGGDEFVIILTNCEEEFVKATIERCISAVENIKYGPNNTISVEADFGYAYTGEFSEKGNQYNEMMDIADKQMYKNKRIHKLCEQEEK